MTLDDRVSFSPVVVELNGDLVTFIGVADGFPAVEPEERGGPAPRIRPDLWRAFTDYRSGTQYAWDATSGGARKARPSDSPIIPTISPGDMAAWRNDFAASQEDPAAIEHWRAKGLSTRALPPALRGPWNGFVRERVAAKIREWFQEGGLETPDILVQPTTRDTEPTAHDIREMVLECVRAMTMEELQELRIPAAALARALARR